MKSKRGLPHISGSIGRLIFFRILFLLFAVGIHGSWVSGVDWKGPCVVSKRDWRRLRRTCSSSEDRERSLPFAVCCRNEPKNHATLQDSPWLLHRRHLGSSERPDSVARRHPSPEGACRRKWIHAGNGVDAAAAGSRGSRNEKKIGRGSGPIIAKDNQQRSIQR